MRDKSRVKSRGDGVIDHLLNVNLAIYYQDLFLVLLLCRKVGIIACVYGVKYRVF